MPSKNLIQIVSYVPPALKDYLEEGRRSSMQRVSMSAYVESILWQHFEHQNKKSMGKAVNV